MPKVENFKMFLEIDFCISNMHFQIINGCYKETINKNDEKHISFLFLLDL